MKKKYILWSAILLIIIVAAILLIYVYPPKGKGLCAQARTEKICKFAGCKWAVIADSTCPAGVMCIWQGRVDRGCISKSTPDYYGNK